MHFRQFFDSEYLGNWDLPRDRDCTVIIAKVEPGTLTGQKGRQAKKAIVYFKGKKKPMAFNVTNAKVVAGMYGNDTRDWVGKAIDLYVTTTDSPQGQVDCIRVRPRVPRQQPANGNKALPPKEEERPQIMDVEPSEEWTPEEPPPGALETDHEQA